MIRGSSQRFCGEIRQQGAQVHFAADGHVGQDSFGVLENIPVGQMSADGSTGLLAGFFAQSFADGFAALAKLDFLVMDGGWHGGIIAQGC